MKKKKVGLTSDKIALEKELEFERIELEKQDHLICELENQIEKHEMQNDLITGKANLPHRLISQNKRYSVFGSAQNLAISKNLKNELILQQNSKDNTPTTIGGGGNSSTSNVGSVGGIYMIHTSNDRGISTTPREMTPTGSDVGSLNSEKAQIENQNLSRRLRYMYDKIHLL